MNESLASRHTERRYQLEVKRNLVRNFSALLCHGMLGQTGFRLINAPTFMPAYIMMLSGGSELAVGCALSLQALGTTLTPLLGATLIEHRRRVLPMGFLAGGAMRASIFFIALSGFILQPVWALASIMFFLTLLGMFQGMQGVIFNFLNSKIIPVSKRGRLTGARNFLAGIVSAIVAWIGGTYLLGESPTMSGYSWTFLLAFILTSIGLAMLLAVREPEPPGRLKKQAFVERLQEIPELLRQDPAFTRYFLARSLVTMGRMAMPFYILFAGSSIGLTGYTLGIVTFAFTISGTVSNLLWGLLADKKGFRLVFLGSILLWIVSTLVLIASQELFTTILVFVGIGAGVQGFQNASQNLTLEFGDRKDLPMRIAVANTASEIAGTLGPLLGGLLATYFGFLTVFILSIVFLAIGSLVVAIYVPEPRHKTQKLQ